MSHNNANALRSIGIDVTDLCYKTHYLGYSSQSTVYRPGQIERIAKDYDVVQLFHSEKSLMKFVEGHKNIIVYHTGTAYRQNPQRMNDFFNPKVKGCITDQTEFMHLGAKKVKYLAPHVDLLPIRKRKSGKLIVGHYPSDAKIKGTEAIKRMTDPFRDDLDIRIDTRKVSHEQHLRRVAACHVYIEMFAKEQEGRTYGCFGVSAFEAAALGSLVITNNLFQRVYEDAYGACPFYICNDEHLFTRIMEELIDCPREHLMTQDYFYESHSIQATGRRILRYIMEMI